LVVRQISHNIFRVNDGYADRASSNDPNLHSVYHGKVSAICSTFWTFRSAYHDKALAAFPARRLCLNNEFLFQGSIGLSFRSTLLAQ